MLASADLESTTPTHLTLVVCTWQKHVLQIVGAVGFQGKQLDRPQHECTFLVNLCMRCMSREPDDRPRFSVSPPTLLMCTMQHKVKQPDRPQREHSILVDLRMRCM